MSNSHWDVWSVCFIFRYQTFLFQLCSLWTEFPFSFWCCNKSPLSWKDQEFLCCLSKLGERLPPSCNIPSCSKCVYKQLSCFWCQPCKKLSCIWQTLWFAAGKELGRFSLWYNYCPNTETGAKLLHLPQVLQGCALCVCGCDVSSGQTLPSSVI